MGPPRGSEPPELPAAERFPSDVAASGAAEWAEPIPAAGVSRRPAAEDPDRELVARWRTGDEAAFEHLVRRHEARVFRFLLRMLGERAEAEDVAQETFLNLHRHGRRFRGEARFATFVYRVAANAALNRRRSLGRRGLRLRRLAERQAAGHDLPASPRDPQAALEGAETERLVQRALLELPVRWRLPLVLYDIEGVAYGEIAQALGIPEGTVKSRIHRARRELREKLRPILASGGEVER